MDKPFHGHSAACCNIPPVVSSGYKEKGKYETIGGRKTYVTGPATAKLGILYVFDIFGYFPQSLQGADILSTSDEHKKYRVFMPDWFDGHPADISWYPPTTDDHKQKLGNFFSTIADPPSTAAKISPFMEQAKKSYPEITKWAIIGFCWGGKLVSLVSGEGTLFSAAAECHPAMVDPSEAEGIKIPLIMLASGDEVKPDVEKFEKNLKGEKHVEIFGDQIHGWMAARSNLDDARVKEEYIRGYKTVVEFFGKHM